MTTITIRQLEGKDVGDSPNATLSFDHVGQYPITITNPFQPEEERRLEWYFEKYLAFPFVEEVKFRQAQESIKLYGQALFDQLFQDRKAYGRYTQARKDGVENLRFEIIGSPEFFHQIHWETLWDPEWPRPFVLDAPMVRTTFQPPVVEAESQPSPTINLLIVTARPNGKNDVGYRTISRPLVESMRQAGLKVKIDILRPGTYEALSTHLDAVRDEHGKGYYHIIHFDVHGSLATYQQLKDGAQTGDILFQTRFGRDDYPEFEGHEAFLFFESAKPGQADPAEAQEIAGLLQSHSIPIAVLNACQSAKMAEDSESSLGSRLMEAGVQTVVAMGYSVTATAASLMMVELYQKLFDGQELGRALCYARKALHAKKNRKAYYDQTVDLEDWMLPVVYQSGGASASSALNLVKFTADEEKAYWLKQSKLYEAPKTTYGFVGRDLDVLEVERRLTLHIDGENRNVLLVQGMGGSGKTTLLKHLMEWWQTTGLVDQVFYFGYDERPWNATQIMDQMAQLLLADKLDMFRALNPAAQRKMLGQMMRSCNHLLVLDNMESITGGSLAIKNTLTAEEQQGLRSLLAELQGGGTLVLLGSRGSEEWLAEGPNPPIRSDDIYLLPGLDLQAASTLAERVLSKHVPDIKKRDQYRKSDEFSQIMGILDGYPLPIQVVLANLASQTPADVLKALKEGGAVQDSKIKDKTESIMLCIEYSHGNLEPYDQKLLMTLAPFTSVVFQPYIEKYTEHLKQQPALASLPFDRWPEVIQQARHWGLITDDQVPGYLRLQPVLPYFLRTRLSRLTKEYEAVEAAYRAHYDGLASELRGLMRSKEPQEKQIGQALARQEYENLYTALELDLKANASIFWPYVTLSDYLDFAQDQERGLKMGERLMESLAEYPDDTLKGPIGADLVCVVDNIAKRQLLLKRYSEAEASYKRALKLSEGLTTLDEKTKSTVQAGIYHQLGIVAQEQRLWEQAQKYYNKALEIYIEFNDRHSQASTYHQLGRVAEEQRQWEQAQKYYNKALEIYIEFNDRHSQASTYHNLGIVAQEQRQWEQAQKYYNKALEIYIEFNDRHRQARTYHNLGIVAQEQRQWEQAQKYYNKAFEIYIEFNDRHSQASTYHQLGIVAQEQRQWEQAQKYYNKALEIYIEFNDRHSQASTYHNLGIVAQEQRQWEQAQKYYNKALEIYIEFNDRHSQASTYHQLGIVAQEQRQWEQAQKYYNKALEIYIEFNDRHSQARTYHQLGIVAQEQRQWEQAQKYYNKALEIKIEFNDRHSQARTYHQLGRVAEEQRQWDFAIENLSKALEIFVEFGDQQSGLIVLRSLARVWQATGDARVLSKVVQVLNTSQEEAKKLLEEIAKQ